MTEYNEQHAAHWAMSYLNSLQAASRSLKKALLDRNPDAIFAAVNKQEEIVGRFRASGDRAGGKPASEDGDETRSALADIVASIKQEQRENKILAASFLSVIDGTLRSLSAGTGEAAVTYDSSGTMGTRAQSILVRQTG